MSKFEKIVMTDLLKAKKDWGDIEQRQLVIISQQKSFEFNEEYEELILKSFEDDMIGVLFSDYTVRKHDKLINKYTNCNTQDLDRPFIVKKLDIPLMSDLRQLVIGYKNSGLKFQHLAEPVFNVF